MAITIFLVRVLNPSGATSSSTVFIASAGYNEAQHVSERQVPACMWLTVAMDPPCQWPQTE